MRPRLWPAFVVVAVAGLWLGYTWLVADLIRQERIVRTLATVAVGGLALMAWFAFFSRLPSRARRAGAAVVAVALVGFGALFRVRGMTGDLVPVLEPRWARPGPAAAIPERSTAPLSAMEAAPPPSTLAPQAAAPPPPAAPARAAAAAPTLADWPQFQGPGRRATVPGPRLARDWAARPPRRLWRMSVGEAWSGFAVSADLALTQEQHGQEERVVA